MFASEKLNPESLKPNIKVGRGERVQRIINCPLNDICHNWYKKDTGLVRGDLWVRWACRIKGTKWGHSLLR